MNKEKWKEGRGIERDKKENINYFKVSSNVVCPEQEMRETF